MPRLCPACDRCALLGPALEPTCRRCGGALVTLRPGDLLTLLASSGAAASMRLPAREGA